MHHMQSHTDEYNQSSTSNVGHTAQSRVVYPICIKTIINVISVSHGNSGLHSMEDFLSLLTNADTTASDTTPSFADFFSLILTHQWYADEACYWMGMHIMAHSMCTIAMIVCLYFPPFNCVKFLLVVHFFR